IHSLTLWRLATCDRAWRTRNLQNPTFVGYRINQCDTIATTQVTHFALDGGEIPGLNLNDVIATQNVNNISIKREFQQIPRSRVPLLQRRMKRLLIDQPDWSHRVILPYRLGYGAGCALSRGVIGLLLSSHCLPLGTDPDFCRSSVAVSQDI